jgi:hypothetical protein
MSENTETATLAGGCFWPAIAASTRTGFDRCHKLFREAFWIVAPSRRLEFRASSRVRFSSWLTRGWGRRRWRRSRSARRLR